ncbi:hypothetical protein BGP78_03340 [Pseudoalteromonas sp. MSK9-3]|uniref:DUF6279 family lipoprotein n=1 Tax=Pseudoalteromonas sp. MSK9-3 TaxID=1897633 RepID=UPI000E6C3062|nr:DUF6279 family lipoprotein [Pseudoalteromonas sp. MSK9-3]RJE73308.1 hypothetical protein BGP78_03340 [Pseudoalteromonas sp. MSK9-3]
MRLLIILLALLTVAGCSTKFAYRNAGWLTYWYLDDYISLTDEQTSRFDERLQLWLSWHKVEELDKYIVHLKQIKADVQAGNMSVQRIAYHQKTLRSHWHRIRNKLAPDLAKMAPMLTQEQSEAFFSELAAFELESIKKRQKYSEQKRKQRWLNKREDGLERWLGDLNDAQEKMIAAVYDNQQDTGDLRSQYRADYQRQLKRLFTQPDRGKQFEMRLLTLLTEPEQVRTADLDRRIKDNRQQSDQFLAAVYQSLSDKQRRHLVEELEALIDDFTSLKRE